MAKVLDCISNLKPQGYLRQERSTGQRMNCGQLAQRLRESGNSANDIVPANHEQERSDDYRHDVFGGLCVALRLSRLLMNLAHKGVRLGSRNLFATSSSETD